MNNTEKDKLAVMTKHPKAHCKKVTGGFIIYKTRYERLGNNPSFNEPDAWTKALVGIRIQNEREIIERKI